MDDHSINLESKEWKIPKVRKSAYVKFPVTSETISFSVEAPCPYVLSCLFKLPK